MIQLHFSDMVFHNPSNQLEIKSNVRFSLGNLYNPVKDTAEALAKGWAISQTDGPLPIMDVVGFGYASYTSLSSWLEYLRN